MLIEIATTELFAILSQRGAVRKLVMTKTKYIDWNVLVIRHIGQIAPGYAPGAPALIGTYREPIAGTTLEIFQTSALRKWERFMYNGNQCCVLMNDIITGTDYTPAITEFVAIRD
jgi:hypothetical protein